LEDPSRVSENLLEKKDLDRHVRALNTFKKDHEVADLAASHFDSDHPLPAVTFCCLCLPCLSLFIVSRCNCRVVSFSRITNSSFLALLSQREGPFHMFLFPWLPKPLRLRTAKMEMTVKIRQKDQFDDIIPSCAV
jgi:hypothetical protein